MSQAGSRDPGDLKVDGGNLYREESYTDLKVATIRKLVPVKLDGTVDDRREPIFVAQTNVMSQVGPVPVDCRLEARTLAQAVEEFPRAIEEAIEELIQEARELRRQQASRIVVPVPGQGLGINPKAGPGMGKIQLP